MNYYADQKFRLPARTTQENLQGRFETVVKYGGRVLLSGYYYMGANKPSYFAAVYQFLDDGAQSVEDDLEFLEVSPFLFEDDGHAIQWAIGCALMK